MTAKGAELIAAAIIGAPEVAEVDTASGAKPRLLIEGWNPDQTVDGMTDILAGTGVFYDRGVPVRLVMDQMQRGTVAQAMTADGIVLAVHRHARPFSRRTRKDGQVDEVDARLPKALASMYLDNRGEWRLPPLNGIASAPLLGDKGEVFSTTGYDAATGMWCERVPDLTGLVPDHPSRTEAAAALAKVRTVFSTFCFADAVTVVDADTGLTVVDITATPGRDESALLVALLTAVCRPSLHLSPGVVLRAPPMSGAGAGKGLLARCIAAIAFGREPHAVTAGGSPEELEKRIAAELIEGGQTVFLDNLNSMALRSDTLASAITERPARVRLLGKSQMVQLNTSAFVVLTGNGLSVSEDLARRFLVVELDPRTEDPEARPFKVDILAEVLKRRPELLAALLTIWRWGRQATDIEAGRPLGSFDQWCHWVRDPLLALGCQDPADRVSEAKDRDGRRQTLLHLFETWWVKHEDRPVTLANLDDAVLQLADPQNRGRQFLAVSIEKLSGTRIGGFVLTRQAAAGRWGAATYALQRSEGEKHRDHRGRGADTPYAPYAVAASDERGGAGEGHRDGSALQADGPSALYAPGIAPGREGDASEQDSRHEAQRPLVPELAAAGGARWKARL